MNMKELKEIIDIFTSRESIEELEVEKSGVRLRMRRSSGVQAATAGATIAPPVSLSLAPAPAVPNSERSSTS